MPLWLLEVSLRIDESLNVLRLKMHCNLPPVLMHPHLKFCQKNRFFYRNLKTCAKQFVTYDSSGRLFWMVLKEVPKVPKESFVQERRKGVELTLAGCNCTLVSFQFRMSDKNIFSNLECLTKTYLACCEPSTSTKPPKITYVLTH